MQIDAVNEVSVFMGEGCTGLPEKCSAIFCSHCFFNTSCHSYGSVSKHVMILILVTPHIYDAAITHQL